MNRLIHFYNDTAHLFKTVTMVGRDRADETFDAIIRNKAWFWHRFGHDDRHSYMLRRYAIEEMLHDEFTAKYWKLKTRTPVYFYLIPGMELQAVEAELKAREKWDEYGTRYVVLDLNRLQDQSNISFTVHDSFRSYRKKLLARGIPCRELENKYDELDDYGKVFHIDGINDIHRKYEGYAGIQYEVQVWDPEILPKAITAKEV